MRLLFATSNAHKIREVSQILTPIGIEVSGLDALADDFPEPEETEATFAANAQLKALAYARMTGITCLAEDSGLEVDALNGAPGVHSARYSGSNAPRSQRDALNNQCPMSYAAHVSCARCASRPPTARC
jgi:XTP/dITP diphosphohydrolase